MAGSTVTYRAAQAGDTEAIYEAGINKAGINDAINFIGKLGNKRGKDLISRRMKSTPDIRLTENILL